MSALESIKQGLREAKAFSKGLEIDACIHDIELPEINVFAIRTQTGLSQVEFTHSIGIAKGTLLNWEHERRTPNGPAQILLALIARKPNVIQELLTNQNNRGE